MSKLLNQILSKLPLSNKDIADLCNIIGSSGSGGGNLETRVDELERKLNEITTDE